LTFPRKDDDREKTGCHDSTVTGREAQPADCLDIPIWPLPETRAVPDAFGDEGMYRLQRGFDKPVESYSSRSLGCESSSPANPTIFGPDKKPQTTKKASPNNPLRNAFQCFIEADTSLLLAALCGSLSRAFLAKQSLLDSNFRKSQWTTAGGKAVFFNQPCNSLTARQHVTRSRKAKSSPESLVN
jgi:hypothetical protein